MQIIVVTAKIQISLRILSVESQASCWLSLTKSMETIVHHGLSKFW